MKLRRPGVKKKKKKRTDGWMDGWMEKRRKEDMAVCALLRIVSYRPALCSALAFDDDPSL
jgi:allantoicase